MTNLCTAEAMTDRQPQEPASNRTIDRGDSPAAAGSVPPRRSPRLDHLALPLFEDRHRHLADRLATWLAEHETEIAPALEQVPEVTGRLLAGMLGRGGWFACAGPPNPDFRSICVVREILACRHDLLDFAFSIQALALAPIVLFAGDDQKAELMPALLSGDAVGSLAISEAQAGSDLAAVAMSAQRTAHGYRLDGEKCWIANATIADLHLVLARQGASTGPFGLSLLAVGAGRDGLRAIPARMMAARAIGHLKFDDCRIDADRAIGREGSGFAVVASVLERFRCTVGAAAVGMARRALRETIEHVRARRIGQERLGDLAITRQRLADMATALETAVLAVARAAFEIDTHAPCAAVRSSLAKLHATEAAQRIVDDCLQLHGAQGLLDDAVSARLYREVRSLRIYEGTSDIQRMIVGEAVVNGRLV